MNPTRRAMLVVALGLAAVLGVARWLEPDPRGYGTHTQLGLYPCMFFKVTGQPCPSCGMTTAFAWFVRGRFDRSWQANPVGSLLALTCLLLIPWLLAGVVRGRTGLCGPSEGPRPGVARAALPRLFEAGDAQSGASHLVAQVQRYQQGRGALD